MRREESHMAVGYQWLYCLGKLITLSFDIYEPAGVQMFSCRCFKKPAKSVNKHLKDKTLSQHPAQKFREDTLKKDLEKGWGFC